MRKNQAGQSISIGMIHKTTGDPVTTGTPVVDIVIDNGTPIVGAGAKTHKINGSWTYLPAQAETNGDHIVFIMSLTNAITRELNVYTGTPQTADNDTKISLIPTTPMRGTDNVPTNPALDTDYTAGRAVNLDNLDTLSSLLATKTQLDGIKNVGAATHRSAYAYTLTTGTQTGGLFSSTEELDQTRHTHSDVGGVLKLSYKFNIGSGSINSAIITGFLNGNNDTVAIKAKDYVTATFKQIGQIVGSNGTTDVEIPATMFVDMVGSGVDEGEVEIEFSGVGLTSANLALDQVAVAFSPGQDGYELGAVWYDDAANNASSTRGIDGVSGNAVSTAAAVESLLVATGLHRVHVAPGSTLTLATDYSNREVFGEEWTLNLNGQTINGTHFSGQKASGVGIGTTRCSFKGGSIGIASLPPCDLFNCFHSGKLTVTGAGTYNFYGSSHATDAGPFQLEFGAAVGNTIVHGHGYEGAITVANMGAVGIDELHLTGNGKAIFEASCVTGGTANVFGFEVVDSSGAGFTLNTSGNLNTQIGTSLADLTIIKDRIGAFTGTGINNILGFFRSLMRSDIAVDPTDIGGTFDSTLHSSQSIITRGDSAWITGGGGGITDMLNVYPLIPMSVDLANTATIRLGLMLTNALDDLPSVAEITPGTISIDHKAIGGAAWLSVVLDVACSEINGLIYFDEVFDSASGYSEGDSLRITFKGQKITVSANDYEIIGATGRFFYTEVRQTVGAGGSSDWTQTEKENFRYRIGIDGIQTAPTNAPVLPVRLDPQGKSDVNAEADTALTDYGANKTVPLGASLTATSLKQDTAQTDLNKLTGLDGATLATAQANYAPAKAGDAMTVSDKTGFSLSSAGILAIWDMLTSGFLAVGSIGKLIKDFLNATISSRSSQTSLDTKIPTNLSFIGADVKVTLDGETVLLSPVTHSGAIIPTVNSLSGHTPQTGDTFAQVPANFKDLSIEITTGKVKLTTAAIAEIWQRVMVEGYAAKGATATPEQMMYMLWSALSEYFVAGTTVTAKKLDGVSVSMTFGTDSATDPTSRARAT